MEKTESPKIIDQNFKYPSFSIVIEWGRFLQADEAWRAQKMLQKLSEQILQASKKISICEIQIVFEPEEIDGSEVEKFAKKELSSCINIIQLRLVPAPGVLYYDMKNLGGKLSSNDLILLIDSDLIPDDGWLEGFLESFGQSDVNVVSGNTYLGGHTLLEKVMGLVLFMPLPDAMDHLYEKLQFYGQNVAFKRELFVAHPFPKSNSFHGHADTLLAELVNDNIKIYRQPKCRAAHPMPDTLKEFVTWGLVQGLSWHVKRKAFNMILKPNTYFKKHNPGSLKQIITRTRKRFRHVGFSLKVYVAACGILPVYFLCIFTGIIMAKIWPNYYSYMIRNKWRMWL